jgi:hypothetical protein
MTATLAPQARTALSPEWEHGFDDEFAAIVTGDPELVQAEFDALIDACWSEPPDEPGPGAARSDSPPVEPPAATAESSPSGDASGDPVDNRPPP